MSLGRQPPPKPEPGVQELPADPLVEADCVGQQGHVAPGRLAHLGHRVDEADLGGQERVGRDLDQLRGGDVAPHHRRTVGDRDRVDLLQHLQRVGGVGAEHQPVRTQGVLHRVRLAQELRVPGHLDLIAGGRLGPQPLLQLHGRAHRHGRLAHDQAWLGEQRGERVDGRVQLGQVGRPARPGRRTQRQEVHVGPVGDLGIVGGEAQPPRAGVLLQQRLQADFEDVRLARIQRLDPIHIDVHTDDVMAEFGHPRRMGRAQIVGADHTYPQSHPQIFAQCRVTAGYSTISRHLVNKVTDWRRAPGRPDCRHRGVRPPAVRPPGGSPRPPRRAGTRCSPPRTGS